MRVDLRHAVHRGVWTRTRNRALLPSVLLAVVVIAAAGIGGTAHFSGARWLPHGLVSGPGKGLQPTVTCPQSNRAQCVRQQQQLKHRTRSKSSSFPFELVLFVIGGILVIVAVVTLWRWWANRLPAPPLVQVPEVPAELDPEPEPEELLTGIELALAALDEQREPGDAVVRAWLGLQETAEDSGIVRQPAETPTEFTSRVLSSAFADDRAIRTLLRLYLRTRFGEHPVTGDDVIAVREALQELVTNWRTVNAVTGVGVK